ncbi:PREDICTED: uncharacterized protein LOC109235188 [Nicotiana attenuata]|uniref:UDP-N-acetylmuramate--L-alanine ligase n=1 Tax=Nicotiana attenuata TaxID=49451 RepID=A0A1J6ID58_NICAT|nr:PREDICTED: uncharacterized protein LOC109235188 [Nicotiana attenuata]OIS95694.1 hypothetical protein A4A49_07891 [Nicotiana attenuata]
MEPPAVKSPLNYPAKCFSYSPAIMLTNRRQMLLRRRKLNYVRTASVTLKFPAVIKEWENCEVIDASERKRKEWIHFVGVGGCGLSALAMLALKQGYEVSGSDIMWNKAMDALREAGARVYTGHSELSLRKHNGSMPDALVVSSAICGDNVEILYAESVGVPVYKRGAWLGRITESYNLIAVSGSHGKSTTASMLAYVLNAMGNDLTAVIGAWVPQLAERNIICGTGGNFVLEADEYDCCFLGVTPQIAVVTNIDWEHVDIFQDEEAVKTIFRKFIGQIKVGGHLILCGDSLGACSLVNKMDSDSDPSSILRNDAFQISTYGISSCNDWHPLSISPNCCGGSDYKLFHKRHHIADISLQIPGVHNVLNSLAVIATIHALFADQKQFLSSMASLQLHMQTFKGVSRRFEKIGTVRGCHIYDDYAHHPTEIQAVLQAARQIFPFQELIVIFQPHTYSRLAALKDDFATAFTNANRVVITEIYAARERNLWKINGRDLAMSIVGPPSEFIPTLIQVLEMLVDQISKDPDHETVILTLGAGDITSVGHKLLPELQQRLL